MSVYDEMRNDIEVLYGRGACGYSAYSDMVDYIDEAGTDYAKLKNENAKLRKLARGLNWCTENAKMPSAECEYCPLGDAGYGELSCERLMRELRIEVKS